MTTVCDKVYTFVEYGRPAFRCGGVVRLSLVARDAFFTNIIIYLLFYYYYLLKIIYNNNKFIIVVIIIIYYSKANNLKFIVFVFF